MSKQQQQQQPVQMPAIDETALVRRYGGVHKKTQLNKGDPELVVEMNVAGIERKKAELQDEYIRAQLRGAFFQALAELYNEEARKPGGASRAPSAANAPQKMQLEVLADTAKIHLNEKYKPMMWTANQGQLDHTHLAKNVNLNVYKKNLETLRADYAKKGQKQEEAAIATLIQAVDRKTRLNPKEVNSVFDTLAKEVKVQKTEAKTLVKNMETQGMLTKEDVEDFDKDESTAAKTERGTVKIDTLTKFASTKVELRPDFTVASSHMPEQHTGYVTFRPNSMSHDPSIARTKTVASTGPSKRATSGITVNLDDRTDRPKTMVNFKTVGVKIEEIKK